MVRFSFCKKTTGSWKCPLSNGSAPLRSCLRARRPYYGIYGIQSTFILLQRAHGPFKTPASPAQYIVNIFVIRFPIISMPTFINKHTFHRGYAMGADGRLPFRLLLVLKYNSLTLVCIVGAKSKSSQDREMSPSSQRSMNAFNDSEEDTPGTVVKSQFSLFKLISIGLFGITSNTLSPP